MWANPTVDGQPYFQGYHKGVAEDVGEVIGVAEVIEVPTGSFDGCIRTADTSNLDAALLEEKVYCPGVGNVDVQEPGADVGRVDVSGA